MKSRFVQILLLAFVVLTTACSVQRVPEQQPATGGPVQPSKPTFERVPTAMPQAASPTPDIEQEIQRLLDAYDTMVGSNDWSKIEKVVDPSNRAFVRLVQERGMTWHERFPTPHRFQLLSVGSATDEFVAIRVQLLATGRVADWTVRSTADGWRLAEPRERQLGERVTYQTPEGISVRAYLWPSANAVHSLDSVIDRALRTATTRLGSTITKRPAIYLKTVFDVAPIDAATSLGYYDASSRTKDRVVIYQPGTFAFGFYDADPGALGQFETVLTHEFIHFVHDNDPQFPSFAGLPDWMREGVAVYASDPGYAARIGPILQDGTMFPIVDSAHLAAPHDLSHFNQLSAPERTDAYQLAAALVAYIAETYGGLDGFWKLARAYQDTSNLDTALQTTFGVSLEEFETDWHAWLQVQYGG